MPSTTRIVAGLAPLLMGASVLVSIAASPAPQQPAIVVHHDDLTIRGCVERATPGALGQRPALVRTRGDIVLSNAVSVGEGALADRAFYWLDDDEDLSTHVGQLVEITVDRGDFTQGEVKVARDTVTILGACPAR